MRRTDQLTDRSNRPSTGRRRRAVAVAAAAALAAVLAPAALSPAGAQDVPSAREYGESGVNSGVVRIEAGSSWLPAGSEGSSSASSCSTSHVKVRIEDDFDQPVNGHWTDFGSDGTLPFLAEPTDLSTGSLSAEVRRFSPTGRWYEVMCDGDIVYVPEGGPYVTVPGLMAQAIDQLDPPEPELAVVPAELHYAQLPSWLAVDPVYWNEDRQRRVSAGRVWVVGHADPAESIWDPGDGTGELPPCGAGTVWQPGLDEAANTCAHTYRRSSAGAPGDAFTLTATVTFDVWAESNAPGADAFVGDIQRTTTLDLQVGEIQAVND